MTFSITDSPAKGWTIWNVRVSPSRQIAWGLAPTMDPPLKRISPEVGAWKPAIR